jgi:thiamine pyrophosphate-dependent acetolactate synthase large subunit-like protein
MALGNLETDVRYRLPLFVVVLNDAAYGAEVHALQVLGVPNTRPLRDTDFAAVATSLGARAAMARSPADLAQLESWLTQPEGPFVLDCRVDVAVRGDWLEEASALWAGCAGTDPTLQCQPF